MVKILPVNMTTIRGIIVTTTYLWQFKNKTKQILNKRFSNIYLHQLSDIHMHAYHMVMYHLMYTYNRCFLGLIWYISSHWQRSIVWRCLLREKFWSLIWQREGCYIVYMGVYNTCSSCLSFVCGIWYREMLALFGASTVNQGHYIHR